MAIFEAATRRGGSHWVHCGVTGRLLGITKRRARFLALHPNGSPPQGRKGDEQVLSQQP